MQIQHTYEWTRFTASTFRNAVTALGDGREIQYGSLTVRQGSRSFKFDAVEEWYAECDRPETDYASFDAVRGDYNDPARLALSVYAYSSGDTEVGVTGSVRSGLMKVLNVFEQQASHSRRPYPPEPPNPAPRVFIGHGHSMLWRDLKDHLSDLHGYEVIAFETGERAGHGVRDVLENLLDESGLAVLVLTGEDEQADGSLRPRENVVHEVGLFQGRLGFNRAIALVEDGVTPFSNLDGIQQIRFSRGNIKETFGSVLAVLRREFGQPPA